MGKKFTDRTALIVGEEGIMKLSHSCVAVFGLGGVGSFAAEALARTGVGTLVLIDHDAVDISNINRQSIALISSVGQKKVDAMRQKIADINPECRIYTYTDFVLEENIETIYQRIKSDISKISFPEKAKIDFMADAVDTVSAKLGIISCCVNHSVPVISCMGTGNKLHPEMFEITDIEKTSVCPLCRVMRHELRTRGLSGIKVLYSKELPSEVFLPVSKSQSRETSVKGNSRPAPGSIAFVPSVAGLMIAGYIVRTILNL